MKNLFDISDMEATESPKSSCKGRVYRGQSQIYWSVTNGGPAWKSGLYFLKKKSCPGCEHCGWAEETLREFISNGGEGIILPEEGIVAGGLYQVRLCNFSRDWETGVVDDYDVEIVRIEDEKASEA